MRATALSCRLFATRTRFSIREDKVSGMAPKYVLIYFDVRGRAEPTRLLFKAAGVEFEDRRFSFEEWGKEKEQFKSGECSVTGVLKRPAKVRGRVFYSLNLKCRLI